MRSRLAVRIRVSGEGKRDRREDAPESPAPAGEHSRFCAEHGGRRRILAVEEPTPGHFYWPELDVDLGIKSIEHPERFPLKSRAPSA